MNHRLLIGDCKHVLKDIPSESIDMCITSPPFWGLRNYGDNTIVDWPDGWKGQLGLEPDFNQYIKHLIEIFQEVKRVLKQEGSLWLNLGDTYSGGGGVAGIPEDWDSISTINREKYPLNPPAKKTELPAKCLIGIPWRVTLKMVEDGWILRNDIIDYKPNHMPGPWTDRFVSSYEHLFFFVKSRKYYFNLDSIRIPHKTESNWQRPRMGQGTATIYEQKDKQYRRRDTEYSLVPPTEPQHGYKGKFEGFGEQSEMYGSPRARTQRMKKEAELKGYTEHSASRLITGLHVKGEEEKRHPLGKNPGDVWAVNTMPFRGAHFATFNEDLLVIPITAACPTKGTVLDIFAGSGTTAKVARDLGRNSISIELNPDYEKLWHERLETDIKSFDIEYSVERK